MVAEPPGARLALLGSVPVASVVVAAAISTPLATQVAAPPVVHACVTLAAPAAVLPAADPIRLAEGSFHRSVWVEPVMPATLYSVNTPAIVMSPVPLVTVTATAVELAVANAPFFTDVV